MRLGPVALTPKIGLRNVGVDTNIFNSTGTPQKDFTATFVSGTDAWLRVGRAVVSSKTTADWVYFQKTASQRSFNVNEDARMDVDLLRLVPRAGGSFLNTRQRPNDEIDERVQQRNVGAFAGVSIPVGSKFSLDLDGRQTRYDYSGGDVSDEDIATALNRQSRAGSFVVSVELTPLTTFSVRAERQVDRFEFTPERNSDSVRVMPGFKFEPSAIISGSAFVGYRKFETPSPAVPNFSGVVAEVELKFLAMDLFRITGKARRDVEYSLDLHESFYVSSSIEAEIVQALGLDWDVVGRVRRGRLAYQQTGASASGRVDHAVQTGIGLGRRLGTDMRIGFDVDYVKRQSAVDTRAFDGFRFGSSVTYGY